MIDILTNMREEAERDLIYSQAKIEVLDELFSLYDAKMAKTCEAVVESPEQDDDSEQEADSENQYLGSESY
jgi:hypothetical protein